MTPGLLDFIAAIAAVAPAEENTSVGGWLSMVDTVLAYLAGGVMSYLVFRWLVRGASDPLAKGERRGIIPENGVALAVLAYLLASMVTYCVSPYFTSDQELANLSIGLVAQFVGAFVCLRIGAASLAGGWRAFLCGPGGFGRGLSTLLVFALIALGLCPEVLELSIELIARLWPDYLPPAHATIAMLDDASLTLVVALWLGAAVLAPIAEELFFRGLLQTLLVNLTGRRWFGIVVASSLFGLVHFSQRQAVLPLVVLSVILGYVYEKTGSLLVPIAIHMIFNLRTLVWFALGAYASP